MMIPTLRFIQKHPIMPGPIIVNGITPLSMSENAKQVWFDIVGKAVDKLDVNAAPVAMAIFKYFTLKGDDKNLVSPLTKVKAQDGITPLLDIHLCLVEKHETEYDYCDDTYTKFGAVLWVGPDGPIDKNLPLDLDEEILGEDEVFDEYEKPDESKTVMKEPVWSIGTTKHFWSFGPKSIRFVYIQVLDCSQMLFLW
jgi:hypothetical protein